MNRLCIDPLRLTLWALMLSASWCVAQYPEDVTEETLLEEKKKEPVSVSLVGRAAYLSHAHDALQHRADYSDESRRHWQDGKVSGDGWGATLTLRNHPHALTLRRESLESTFKATPPGVFHKVESERDDWEILYWHTQEGRDEIGETGAWGWQVGVRHIGSRKSISLRELSRRLEQSGTVTWKTLQGGYWGVFRPVAWRARIFGAIHFLFGEVDGLARLGNDTERDGKISETYRNDQGLAYGMAIDVGVGIDLLKYAVVNFGYRRDWLYSFQATDSGVVVFPDNDDALFIENLSSLYAEIGVRFRF